MSLGTASSVTKCSGTESPPFYHRKTKELLRKQLFLARDHQVVLQPSVEVLHTPQALHTKCCNDLYGSVSQELCSKICWS